MAAGDDTKNSNPPGRVTNDRIKKEWDSFAKAVLPADVHPVQYSEMRRAFMGGAHAMLTLMLSLSGDDVSEEAGAVVLEEARMELVAFQRRVGTGNY
jgi:hypothetical protein